MGLKAVVPLHFVWTSPYCFLARLLSNFCFQPWWLTRQTWMGGLTLLEWLVVRALGREHPSQLFIVSLWLVWSEARPSWQIQEAACKKQGKKVSPGIIWGKCDKGQITSIWSELFFSRWSQERLHAKQKTNHVWSECTGYILMESSWHKTLASARVSKWQVLREGEMLL